MKIGSKENITLKKRLNVEREGMKQKIKSLGTEIK